MIWFMIWSMIENGKTDIFVPERRFKNKNECITASEKANKMYKQEFKKMNIEFKSICKADKKDDE